MPCIENGDEQQASDQSYFWANIGSGHIDILRHHDQCHFHTGFLFSANEHHWSNEKETLKYVITPYLGNKRKEPGLPSTRKVCLVWDAFSGQDTGILKEKLQVLDIAEGKVPKNMTHLLLLVDLTTNGTEKKIEKREFSSYFTKGIMQAMLKDPNI